MSNTNSSARCDRCGFALPCNCLSNERECARGLIRWLEDQILTFIQGRCTHPGMMVAVDILEGCGGDYEVAHCRRCGSTRVNNHEWRNPLPNLWRGR